MKRSLCYAFAVFALGPSGCARIGLASAVPALELRAFMRRDATTAHAHEAGSERWHATVSAWLRWQQRIAAAGVPLRFELEPASALAPCAQDDDECFIESAELERELDHVLSDLP